MILEPSELPTEKLPRRFYGPKIGWMYFPLNFGKRIECINLSSCNCSVRREIALKVGGFDENFRRTLFDDSDFSWRVHLYCKDRGLRIIHDPEAYLTHLRVPTGGKRPGKINSHIVADAEAWENLLYFHLNHIGLEALRVIFQRYRWWVWHKKNILEPCWLMKAHYEMIKGLSRLLQALRRGPQLISQDIA
jgi:GT2 family glycosyltransferase